MSDILWIHSMRRGIIIGERAMKFNMAAEVKY